MGRVEEVRVSERLSDARLLEIAFRDRPTPASPLPMPKACEVHAMAKEIIDLRNLCSEIYQVVGVLVHNARGVFDITTNVLDQLVAAANGNVMPHATLLPFCTNSPGSVMPDGPPPPGAFTAGPVLPTISEPPSAAALDVLAERRRQIEKEGRTPQHDDGHDSCELARAAAAYALSADGSVGARATALAWWPWSTTWLQQTTPRRDLVKAGALILAEIERLDRADLAKEHGDD